MGLMGWMGWMEISVGTSSMSEHHFVVLINVTKESKRHNFCPRVKECESMWAVGSFEWEFVQSSTGRGAFGHWGWN